MCIAILVVPRAIYAENSGALSLTSSKNSIVVGEESILTVTVASPDQAMNAVSGTIIFPAYLSITGIEKGGSIVNFWTEEPHPIGNRVQFEGVILNPGYQGVQGKLFTVTTTAKKSGTAPVVLSTGTILANDGMGTNILGTLGVTTIAAKSWQGAPLTNLTRSLEVTPTTASELVTKKTVALPVITSYPTQTTVDAQLYLQGRGEPEAFTKIIFEESVPKSIGEQLVDFIQNKKKKLDEVLIRNDVTGFFEYVGPENLVAGVYNATPFLIDKNTNIEQPGLGVQLVVADTPSVRVVSTVLNLLIIVILLVGIWVILHTAHRHTIRKIRKR